MAFIPKRAAVLAAALAVGALGAGGATQASAATCTGADTALNHSSAATLGAAESGMACLVNNARAAAGLPALAVKSDLTSVARTRAADFAAGGNNYACNKISAWSVCWESWAHWFPTPTATTAFNGWMNDAGSKSRILNTSVTEIGIGIVNGNRTEGPSGSGASFDMVEVKRTTSAPAPAPAPAPPPAPAPADPSGCVTSDYDKTVNLLSQAAAEKAVFCLTNEQRKANGKP